MPFDPRPVRHAYGLIADGYAETFGDDLERSAFDRSVLENAIAVLPPAALVVDVGCGPGQVASFLSARGCRALGLDLTPAMLNIARQRNSDLPLVGGDILHLPLRGGAVDGIVAWYSLHNLPRALLTDALTEVRRALRDGGVFVMSTHAGDGEELVEHDWQGETEQVAITYYEPAELEAAFADTHLRVMDLRSRPPVSHEHAVTKLFITATPQ